MRTWMPSMLVTLIAASASAAEPLVMSHTGYLVGGDDVPVNGPDVEMSFAIYALDLPVINETALWSGGCSVNVSRGRYAVALGSNCGTGLSPEVLPLGAMRFLEVTVAGVKLLPRLQLGAFPAAAVAGDAMKLGGVASSGYWQKADAVEAKTLEGKALADLDARYAKVEGSGSVSFTGTVTATAFAGSGASLTDLSASALTGQLPSARLAGTYSEQVEFSNGANHFTGLFVGDGSELTSLDASQLTGTLPASVLPASIEASRLIGPVPEASLPEGLARLGVAQTFTAPQAFGALTADSIVSGGPVRVGTATTCSESVHKGAIRFTGTAFEGCNGKAWIPLSLPIGQSAANPGRSCKQILEAGADVGDGVYWIDPNGGTIGDAFRVHCDMTSDGGGWTLVAYNYNVKRSFLTGSYHAVAGELIPTNGKEAAIDPAAVGLEYTQIGFYLTDPQWKSGARDYNGFWVGDDPRSTYNVKSNSCQVLRRTSDVQWNGTLVYFGGDGANDNGCNGGGSYFTGTHTCDDGGGGVTTNNAWAAACDDTLWGCNCISSYSPTGAYKSAAISNQGLHAYYVR